MEHVVAAMATLRKRNDSDSSSSSSDELLLIASREKHHKIDEYIEQVVSRYSLDDFKSHFRLTKSAIEVSLVQELRKCYLLLNFYFKNLCSELQYNEDIGPGRPPIKRLHALLITVWTLGKLYEKYF